MSELESSVDLVVAVGTGFTSDTPGLSILTQVAERSCQGESLGVVIINSSPTCLDHLASLRIFSNFDNVASNLATYLNIKIIKPDTKKKIEHKSIIPYDADGHRSENKRMHLDLTPGQSIRLHVGHNCQVQRWSIKHDLNFSLH